MPSPQRITSGSLQTWCADEVRLDPDSFDSSPARPSAVGGGAPCVERRAVVVHLPLRGAVFAHPVWGHAQRGFPRRSSGVGQPRIRPVRAIGRGIRRSGGVVRRDGGVGPSEKCRAIRGALCHGRHPHGGQPRFEARPLRQAHVHAHGVVLRVQTRGRHEPIHPRLDGGGAFGHRLFGGVVEVAAHGPRQFGDPLGPELGVDVVCVRAFAGDGRADQPLVQAAQTSRPEGKGRAWPIGDGVGGNVVGHADREGLQRRGTIHNVLLRAEPRSLQGDAPNAPTRKHVFPDERGHLVVGDGAPVGLRRVARARGRFGVVGGLVHRLLGGVFANHTPSAFPGRRVLPCLEGRGFFGQVERVVRGVVVQGSRSGRCRCRSPHMPAGAGLRGCGVPLS